MLQTSLAPPAQDQGAAPHVDVVVVGAGFSGLYMLYKLRKLGLSVRVFEAGGDVGGTWYWNRYCGARCDIESVMYSYSFSHELQQDWRWTERYATQPEILDYINHVADRFDLRRDITFNTRVSAAHFDEATGSWTVTLDSGERLTADACVMASGTLSAIKQPDFPGLDRFGGRALFTGAWPHEGVDFTGLRVGVIGTGSSGVQCIPMIAEQAAHLVVFQRTPNFCVPAGNRPLTDEEQQLIRINYAEMRTRARHSAGGSHYDQPLHSALAVTPEERRQRYETLYQLGGIAFLGSFNDLLVDREANATAVAFLHQKIRDRVKDQDVAAMLLPQDHPIGTKRICSETGYYETFNRDNVTLVDVKRAPIVEMVPDGLRTTEATYKLDAIVFATGFDALTGALSRVDIVGRDGLALREKWAAGPQTLLGIMTAGFPNLFIVGGPGSPSALASVMVVIEQNVDWIADCIARLHTKRELMEPDPQAEQDWTRLLNTMADRTLFREANSWYLGANVPGKPRVFMPYSGGVGTYRSTCDRIAASNYEGFRRTVRA